MKPSFPLAVVCAAILSLSACGGGGSDRGANASSPDVDNPSALATTDSTVGSGPEAVPGARVQVAYTGWLYSAGAAGFKGRRFDASKSGKPFTFVVGAGGTDESAIPGFSQGVQGMRVGGRRTLLIPSSLGYGAAGVPGFIPGNTGLVFEVELVRVCGGAAC